MDSGGSGGGDLSGARPEGIPGVTPVQVHAWLVSVVSTPIGPTAGSSTLVDNIKVRDDGPVGVLGALNVGLGASRLLPASRGRLGGRGRGGRNRCGSCTGPCVGPRCRNASGGSGGFTDRFPSPDAGEVGRVVGHFVAGLVVSALHVGRIAADGVNKGEGCADDRKDKAEAKRNGFHLGLIVVTVG